MSVINRVLQDLEKRGVDRDREAPFTDYVRAVPKQAPGLGKGLLAALAALGAGAALAWALFQGRSPSSSLPRLAASPVPAQLTATQVAASAPAPAPDSPSRGPAAEAPAGEQAAPPPASRMSLELGSPPAASPGPSQRPAGTEKAQVTAPNSSWKGPLAGPPTEPRREAPISQAKPAPAAAVPEKRSEPPPVEKSSQEPVIEKQVTPRQRADNEFRRAVAFMNQGRIEEAVESLRAALKTEPGFDPARQALVGLLLKSQRMAEAKEVLKEGLRLNPKQVGFAMMLARIQVEQGETSNALATLQAAAPYAQKSAEYQGFYAALLMQESRYQEAVQRYRNALGLAPDTGVWWMGLGMALQGAGKPAEAQQAFHRAVASGQLTPELQAFVEQRLKKLNQP